MGTKAITLEELKAAYKQMFEAEEYLKVRKATFLTLLKRASSKLVKEFYITEGR